MNLTADKKASTQILTWSLIVFAFALPTSTALINLALFIAFVAWIIEGRWLEKIQCLRDDKFIQAFGLLLITLVISALFSEYNNQGFLTPDGELIWKKLVGRFIWVPLIYVYFITSFDRSKLPTLVSALLSGMFFSEITSYMVFFQWVDIQQLKALNLLHDSAQNNNPSPFMNRIFYSYFLAATSMLLFHMLPKQRFKKVSDCIVLCFFLITVSNLFLNGGRVGQVAFILAMVAYLTVSFRAHWRRLAVGILMLVIFLVTAIQVSPIFNKRVGQSIASIEKLKNQDYNSSIGRRVLMNKLGLAYVTESPERIIFGAGIADSRAELNQYVLTQHNKKSKEYRQYKRISHLHNQYLQFWLDAGLPAILSLMLILIALLKQAIHSREHKALFLSWWVIIAASPLSDNLIYAFKPFVFTIFLAACMSMMAQKETHDGSKKPESF